MKILHETKEVIFRISMVVLYLVTFLEILNFALHLSDYINLLTKGYFWSYWIIIIIPSIIQIIKNKKYISALYNNNKLDLLLLMAVNIDVVFLGYMFVVQILK